MKIKISTLVNKDYKFVYENFERDLFEKLSPPWVKVKLERFDGSKKGDYVILNLDFIFFKQEWVSLITEDSEDMEEIYFIDRGEKLPFFLKYWNHKHRILKKGNQSLIIDQIEFKTPFCIPEIIMYPLLYLQFFYRKPIYKNFFR